MKLVEVTWSDHTFTFGEYTSSSAIVTTVTTVGYLVRSDASTVVVAMSLADGKPQECQVIDRRMLKSVRTIRR